MPCAPPELKDASTKPVASLNVPEFSAEAVSVKPVNRALVLSSSTLTTKLPPPPFVVVSSSMPVPLIAATKPAPDSVVLLAIWALISSTASCSVAAEATATVNVCTVDSPSSRTFNVALAAAPGAE